MTTSAWPWRRVLVAVVIKAALLLGLSWAHRPAAAQQVDADPTPAEASAPAAERDQAAPRTMGGRYGIAVLARPQGPGASQHRVMAVPDAELRWSSGWRLSPIAGLEYRLPLSRAWSVSGALAWDFTNRDAGDEPAWRGLSDVPMTPALRLGTQWDDGAVRAKALWRERLGGADRRGGLLELEAGLMLWQGLPGEHLQARLFGGAEAAWMDRRYAQLFFGVDAAAAQAGMLPLYDASASWRDAGPWLQLEMRCSGGGCARWGGVLRLAAPKLVDVAADSPVTQRLRQNTLLLAIGRAW